MYTLNYNKTNKSNVVSFPNKDSIIQMEELKNRNTKGEAKNTEYSKKTSVFDFETETLMLFGALIAITNDETINEEMFSLIAGILLSL